MNIIKKQGSWREKKRKQGNQTSSITLLSTQRVEIPLEPLHSWNKWLQMNKVYIRMTSPNPVLEGASV